MNGAESEYKLAGGKSDFLLVNRETKQKLPIVYKVSWRVLIYYIKFRTSRVYRF